MEKIPVDRAAAFAYAVGTLEDVEAMKHALEIHELHDPHTGLTLEIVTDLYETQEESITQGWMMVQTVSQWMKALGLTQTNLRCVAVSNNGTLLAEKRIAT